jgi:pimeloyl-ACP methyl ester carboxylesterase
VVLVHGAWADASGWSGVIPELSARGIAVLAPPNELRGVANDSAYITSVVDQIPGPVLLVGHSYGGAVITAAGSASSNVVGLVYVSAFAPDAGESLFDIIGGFPDTPLAGALRPTTYPVAGAAEPAVEFSIDREQFHTAFCADVTVDLAAVMAVSQRPITQDAFAVADGVPAWKTLPSWFVVSKSDNAIHPDAERTMAKRAGSDTIELEASHCSMVSQPHAVAGVIHRAVQATTA